MCREYGLPSDHLLVGIAAALLYDHAGDEQACEIQQTISEKGLEAAIVEYTTLEAGSKEVTGIMKAYESLNATRVQAPGSPSPSVPSTPI
jgi:mannitol-1-phosphate 5-dehydrogenase